MGFEFHYPETKAVLAIIISIISFICYFFIITSKKLIRSFESKFSDDSYFINHILFNKITGFIIFAIVPGLLFFLLWQDNFFSFGFSIDHFMEFWYWLLGLPAVIILLNFFSARSPDIYSRYPQMRIQNWSFQTFLISASGWTLYLIGYEFLFRGILLFNCIEAFGIWPAIAINVAIYSLIHIPNGLKEALGAIPFGLIACLLAIETGSILLPIIMHISLSVSTEYFSIRYNPEMKFVKKLKR